MGNISRTGGCHLDCCAMCFDQNSGAAAASRLAQGDEDAARKEAVFSQHSVFASEEINIEDNLEKELANEVEMWRMETSVFSAAETHTGHIQQLLFPPGGSPSGENIGAQQSAESWPPNRHVAAPAPARGEPKEARKKSPRDSPRSDRGLVPEAVVESADNATNVKVDGNKEHAARREAGLPENGHHAGDVIIEVGAGGGVVAGQGHARSTSSRPENNATNTETLSRCSSSSTFDASSFPGFIEESEVATDHAPEPELRF